MEITTQITLQPNTEELKELNVALKANKLLQAWALVGQWSPLDQWQGAKAARSASSLMARLGGSRQAQKMDILNARRYPDDAQCFLFGLFTREQMFGALRTLSSIEGKLGDDRVVGQHRSDLMAMKAVILSEWNDFSRATPLIDEACAVSPQDSWVHVQKSRILVNADRYSEAEELARHALSLRVCYAPAIMQLVDCLIHLGQDDEAIDVLMDAHGQTENGAFAGRLQSFFSERDDHHEGMKWLDEYERLMPLLDKPGKKWLASRQCDFHIMANEIQKYITLSGQAGKYHKTIAKHLEKNKKTGPSSEWRKRLDVPFIRQHHVTCAPATLASIARYFGKEHDHLEIAEAICYDGTPWHKERGWAESHGYIVHEFRVTREVVIDLINRGVPFTLTTSWVSGAHLQACIGYDDQQGVIITRDPTHRHYGEMILEDLIGSHPIDGPRGMVLVPEEKSHLLDGVHFPDEVIYDACNALMQAIDSHDRVKIMAAFSIMRACGEDHPLLLSARLSLAWYDRDASEERKVADEMFVRFPDHGPTQIKRVYAIQKTEGYQMQKQALLPIIEKGNSEAVFYSEIGELMLGDVSDAEMAEYYLHKAIRRNPFNSRGYASLARYEFQRRNLDGAMELRRIAACLSYTFEPYSKAYFDCCVATGNIEEGLDFLRTRIGKLGDKHSGPWITLADGLEDICRDEEARGVLDKAVEKCPQDGDLMLAVAEKLAGWGEVIKAQSLLAKARELVTENAWCRETASVADTSGDRGKAIRYWKRVLEIEEPSMSAQRNYCRLLADEQGPLPVLGHLSKLCERYPQREELWTLYAGWMEDVDRGKAIEIMKKAVSLAPNDTWNLRELALYHERSGDFETALELAIKALEKNPRIAESQGILGGVYKKLHRYSDAKQCYRQALKLDIDYTHAIDEWCECALEQGVIKNVLGEILELLRKGITTGGAISSYRRNAYKHIKPDILLAELKSICKQRPDLWQSWVELKGQQLDMSLYDEALGTVKYMVEKFPLLPRVWAELAEVHRLRGEHREAAEGLEKALILSPSWDILARKLSEVYESLGRYQEAEDILRSAITWSPRDAANYGMLADLLAKQGQGEEAFDVLAEGLEKDPDYSWGWGKIAEWAVKIGRESRVWELLDIHNGRFKHMGSWWEKVAGINDDLGDVQKALEATEKGLLSDPRAVNLHGARAYYLCKLNRLHEAIEATSPPIYGDSIPRELLARRAWIYGNYGHAQKAETLFIQIIKDHPDYVWPRRELLSIRHAANDSSGVLEAAKEVIRLEPENVLAYGWLGSAYEQLDREEESIEAYKKSLLLDPSYTYGAFRLFEVYRKRGTLENMRGILPQLEHYQPGGFITCIRVSLHCGAGEFEKACSQLRLAFEERDIDDSDVDNMRESFEKSGWIKHYKKIIDETVDVGKAASPAVLNDWLWGKRFPMRLAKRVHAMNYPMKIKEGAWSGIMNWIVSEKFDDEAVKLVKMYPEIKESVFLWGQASWMLSSLSLHDAVVSLMTPLKYREGIEDWMIYNLCVALVSTKGPEAARFASQFALQHVPPNDYMVYHAMSEAVMYAAEKDDVSAIKLLDQYGGEARDLTFQLKILAEMILSSSDQKKSTALWSDFENNNVSWRESATSIAFVKLARKTFKSRKAKWPGPRLRIKVKAEKKSSGSFRWWWLVVIYFVIKIIGWAF